MKSLIAITAVVASLAGPVSAGSLQEALDLYAGGNPAGAAAIYGDLAAQGDGRAQFNLALMFYAGEGVPQSYDDAFEWAWRAKLQGIGASEALLARISSAIPNDRKLALADLLAGELAPRIDQADGRAMLAMAIIETDLKPRPDPVQVYVWQSLAVAVGLDSAASLRDKTFGTMSDRDRAKAQTASREAYVGWCASAKVASEGCVVVH